MPFEAASSRLPEIPGRTMKLVTKAALASLALAAPAQAADLFGSAAPASFPESQAPTTVEIGSNWYLRGDVGVSLENQPTAAYSPALGLWPDAPVIPLGTTTWGGGGSTNFDGGLGVGYRFNNYLRFDATWDLSVGPLVGRSTSFACSGGPAMFGLEVPGFCYGTFNAQRHTNTVLANAYVDLGTWGGITPYLGGGAGLSAQLVHANTIYSQSGLAVPFSQILESRPPVSPISEWGNSINTSAFGFAWALMAGLSYQITPSIAIDIGYRYLNGGPNVTLVDPWTGTTLRQSRVSQQVRVGVRYLIQ
jgi:opacity protein-like surface antigen